MAKDKFHRFLVPPGKKIRLKDYDPSWDGGFGFNKDLAKDRAADELAKGIAKLSEVQEKLYASDSWSILLIFQAMDAAGKDGTIKHVMSGVNPQGCQVFSFKHPSTEELDHNFLWRYTRALPERGRIGVFNRSYYEDVLIVRVHPELVRAQRVPGIEPSKQLWRERYEDINNLEQHLTRNGTLVLKFFLNVSRDEQRKRFLDRLDHKEKHWKFSVGDIRERGFWNDYMDAYESALNATSTEWAPWYVIPADQKWVTRASVVEIINARMRELKLEFPKVGKIEKQGLKAARRQLERED